MFNNFTRVDGNCIIYIRKKILGIKNIILFWTQSQTLDPPDPKGLNPKFSNPMDLVVRVHLNATIIYINFP